MQPWVICIEYLLVDSIFDILQLGQVIQLVPRHSILTHVICCIGRMCVFPQLVLRINNPNAPLLPSVYQNSRLNLAITPKELCKELDGVAHVLRASRFAN